MTQAQTITSKAKSNLAFALIDLPEEERRHMAEFYAFCRTVDDIVDEPGMTPRERHDALNRWVEVINGGEGLELTELEEDIIALIQDLELDTTPMLHLIEGCRSDICQQQPRSRDELLDYTYCVACCVGLTSARIMGREASIRTPLPWGTLQMVNIIRDVANAASPAAFICPGGYGPLWIHPGRPALQVHSPRLQELLKYEADLAGNFFAEAEGNITSSARKTKPPLFRPGHGAHLPTILDKMKASGFRIFDIRYRVNTFHKLWLLFRTKLDIDPQSYYDKSKAYYDKLVGFLSRPGRKDEKQGPPR
ncbi:MAG: phytoene/squalene synthase family protein [Akkermansia sp.]